ncbi:uncharacterized protein LOC141657610 [Silene latifolia]|uniref:uncharacterized protein LOC141657610 n=1 Tax=Silene latifolia TaxID=37657 RepID=UPI003D77D706
MALSISSTYNTLLKPSHTSPKTLLNSPSSLSYPSILKVTPFSLNHHHKLPTIICAAAKQQSGSSVKPNNKKKKKKAAPIVSKGFGSESLDRLEDKEFGIDDDDIDIDGGGKGKRGDVYVPLPLPKPPAGFVVDDQGRVLMVAPKRLATIVDPTNNLPLECLIRRVFTNSKGEDCMLLCPVDTPIQILKSTNIEGWSAVSDDEVESILPTAAYALAKIHMHLVQSGFCYTARGGFCYSEESIFEFRSDDGQNIDGVPTEGVEITCFHLDGSHYMIYTPSDPLLFVVAKDEIGQLRIADDDLLDDPAVVGAIDEETEFNALVEEEAALLESMFGER